MLFRFWNGPASGGSYRLIFWLVVVGAFIGALAGENSEQRLACLFIGVAGVIGLLVYRFIIDS